MQLSSLVPIPRLFKKCSTHFNSNYNTLFMKANTILINNNHSLRERTNTRTNKCIWLTKALTFCERTKLQLDMFKLKNHLNYKLIK